MYSESERVKRDTPSGENSSEREDTTTTANKIYINENKNKSEAGGLTDDFLKKQVFLNKTEKENVKTTHKDYSFDNVSKEYSYRDARLHNDNQLVLE